jgi:hypothetical protein
MGTNLGRCGDVFGETNLAVNLGRILGQMHLIIYFGEMKGRSM